MRILMIGDVIGRGGRNALCGLLPGLRDELNIDFVTAQGENLAGGFGLTRNTVADLLDSGVDVVTTGNHVWDKREFVEDLDDHSLPVLRPMNYPAIAPGRGCIDMGPVAVVNLIGRVFVGEFDSPFAVVDELLASGWGQGKPLIVDFHAEATSEKVALGWHLDGRVAAVVRYSHSRSYGRLPRPARGDGVRERSGHGGITRFRDRNAGRRCACTIPYRRPQEDESGHKRPYELQLRG